MEMEGIEWVVDVIPWRNSPQNFRILKMQGAEGRPTKCAGGFFRSDDIKSV